jgi:protein involved in polysaccharide export with SLBB domain
MEGGISVEVNLWGYVRNPGLYRVPSSTDVLGLLSYGGGPLENATLSEVKLIRREMKTDSTYADKILVIDVDRVTETGSRKGVPTLLPGDVVLVPGSGYSQWANLLSIFTQVVLVVSGIFSIVRLAQNK